MALLRNERRFRSVFETAPVGVVISGLDGTPLDANPQMVLMLGCTPANLDAHYRSHSGEDARWAEELVRSGQPSLSRLRAYESVGGRDIQTLFLMSQLRDGEGRPEGHKKKSPLSRAGQEASIRRVGAIRAQARLSGFRHSFDQTCARSTVLGIEELFVFGRALQRRRRGIALDRRRHGIEVAGADFTLVLHCREAPLRSGEFGFL